MKGYQVSKHFDHHNVHALYKILLGFQLSWSPVHVASSPWTRLDNRPWGSPHLSCFQVWPADNDNGDIVIIVIIERTVTMVTRLAFYSNAATLEHLHSLLLTTSLLLFGLGILQVYLVLSGNIECSQNPKKDSLHWSLILFSTDYRAPLTGLASCFMLFWPSVITLLHLTSCSTSSGGLGLGVVGLWAGWWQRRTAVSKLRVARVGGELRWELPAEC